MAEIAYPLLTHIEEIVEEGMDVLSETALTALLAEVPWLNLPVVKQIFTGMWHLCIRWYYKYQRLVVDMTAICLVNKANDRDLDREGTKLAVLARDFGTASSQFLKQKEVYREKFKVYTRYGATLPPV